MDDIKILDTVERYIRGEMTPDERLYFEQLRKTNPEVDQLVVEHTLFLQQMNRFGEWKTFKQALHETHIDLTQQGKIRSDKLRGGRRLSIYGTNINVLRRSLLRSRESQPSGSPYSSIYLLRR